MANYALNFGRLRGLDVTEFEANFSDLFKILDSLKEIEHRGDVATFEPEVTNRRTELNTIFGEVKL